MQQLGISLKRGYVAALALVLGTCGAALGQNNAPSEHGGQASPGNQMIYPDRPKAPKEILDRGRAGFSVSCAFCHGSDAGGGSVGPNLLRSEVVLQDQNGELLLPIVHGARADRGMPKIDIPDSQVPDIAAWLHSLKTGGKLPSTEKINIVVGDSKAGKQAFDRICASCHSVTGDLKGFAAKYNDPRAMQQAWLLPGGAGGAGGGGRGANDAPALHVPPLTATVVLPTGGVTGRVQTLDDFYVSVITDDGTVHRFLRSNDLPEVRLHDPLEAHRALFRKYADKDIHDITAYLESVK
jgi:cytochrome c oxidase cbb3-type subunit III